MAMKKLFFLKRISTILPCLFWYKQSSVYLVAIITILLLHLDIKSSAQTDTAFRNPALIMGSDWGKVFQTYYRQADFEKMMLLTSKQSIEKFNKTAIDDYYRRMEFGYSIKLKSLQIKDGIYTLNYKALVYGTSIIVRMNLVVENDTCKIVLPDDVLDQKIFLKD
jgi:hypothetical protein